MKRLAIILLILLLVVPVGAKISDKLSPANPPDVNAKIKAEEYSKLIIANETTTTKDAIEFKYNIKKIQYDIKRGTVDIWCNLYIDGVEKAVRNPIHVYNPPVYHITGETIDIKTGQSKPTYIEDPDVVLSQILYDHAITLKDGKAENDDTLIIFSSSSIRLARTTNGTWDAMHDGTGELSEAGSYLRGTTIDSSITTDIYDRLGRRTEKFDSSGIGANCSTSIDSATLGLYYYAVGSGLGKIGIALTGYSPGSYNIDQASDYDKYSDTRLATDITYGDLGSGFNYFTLNAAGISYINSSGITPMMIRLVKDVDDTAPTWEYETASYVAFYGTPYTGTSRDPKLTITYTTGGASAPVAGFANTTGFPLSGPAPLTVQFEDQSTNTPTTHNWSIKNATSGWKIENTSQNATIVFPVAGEWDVSLRTCNVAGCDFENKTAYVTVLGTTPTTTCYYMNMTNATVQNATWTAPVQDGWVGVEANASNSTAYWYHCVTPATPATTATTPPPTPIPNLPAGEDPAWAIWDDWRLWILGLLFVLWLVKK